MLTFNVYGLHCSGWQSGAGADVVVLIE